MVSDSPDTFSGDVELIDIMKTTHSDNNGGFTLTGLYALSNFRDHLI